MLTDDINSENAHNIGNSAVQAKALQHKTSGVTGSMKISGTPSMGLALRNMNTNQGVSSQKPKATIVPKPKEMADDDEIEFMPDLKGPWELEDYADILPTEERVTLESLNKIWSIPVEPPENKVTSEVQWLEPLSHHYLIDDEEHLVAEEIKEGFSPCSLDYANIDDIWL